MADLLLRYLRDLGSLCHRNAELAGRTEINLNDVLLTFEEKGIDLHKLETIVNEADDFPFAQPLQAFPVHKKARAKPSFDDKGEAPPPHVPAHLAAFPDAHTFRATALVEHQPIDPRRTRLQEIEKRQEQERALINQHKRLAAAGGEGGAGAGGASTSGRPGDDGDAAAAGGNPFLRGPRWEESSRVQTLASMGSGGVAAGAAAGKGRGAALGGGFVDLSEAGRVDPGALFAQAASLGLDGARPLATAPSGAAAIRGTAPPLETFSTARAEKADELRKATALIRQGAAALENDS
jgi:hypothetical protein